MRINDICVNGIDTIKEIFSKYKVIKVAICKDNIPYLVPLSYAYEFSGEELILYCYCTNKDKKLDILDKNPNILIKITNKKDSLEDISHYELKHHSIISPCKVEYIYNIYDKIQGLSKIIEHYSPRDNYEFRNEALNNIILLKITCNNISSKNCVD